MLLASLEKVPRPITLEILAAADVASSKQLMLRIGKMQSETKEQRMDLRFPNRRIDSLDGEGDREHEIIDSVCHRQVFS